MPLQNLKTRHNLFKSAYNEVQRPRKWMWLMAFAFVLMLLYPSDIKHYQENPKRFEVSTLVNVSEHYLRFINTGLQIALPLLLQDKVGVVQLVYVGIATTVTTFGFKNLVNDWMILGTRLGQRPWSEGSQNNSPSGHSSMASCALYFVCRRYGWKFIFLMGPILGLTMYARLMLDAHTISAVLSGALLGFLVAAFFTSPYRR